MLLFSSPRCGRRRRASLLLPLLSAVLLCVIPVSARLPDKIKAYDLDEEIDFLHSIIERQEVLEMKQQTTRKQSKHPVAIISGTDRKNSKTDASKHKKKIQGIMLSESLNISTAAPSSNAATPQPWTADVEGRAGPIPVPAPMADTVIIIIISVCVVVGTVAVILATVCYIKFQKESHLAEKVDYPAFGGAGVSASGTSMGDKTLAQSAQMFHYQHQKQQMLSMGNHKPEQKVSETEGTSDEEEVGGDFTVYECPGLAPTGEMEVKNPLFDDSAVPYQGNAK
ncbi:neural proliferation differentiation and control protein 1-like [Astatotilapia calliptera]|uniref:Neural proliferation, differentiation and control, 1a n=1 Tax=Astatotilapia calliptera TaxID=8154 RepID=A0A3P8QQU4_ASTCA|nr:neural proliferation differentiation and control protein 1-like [Astatotilapia calliptera]